MSVGYYLAMLKQSTLFVIRVKIVSNYAQFDINDIKAIMVQSSKMALLAGSTYHS